MARRIFLLLLFAASYLGASPEALYLTWEEAPDSSMVISWLSKEVLEEDLKFRQADSSDWYALPISRERLEKIPEYILYRVELTKLHPDTRYEFLLPKGKESYSFYTLPDRLSKKIKFVVGGDIYHDEIELVEEMNQIAASEDPDFALLGGDIAYAGAKFTFLPEDAERWVEFLRTWTKTMVRSDGALIPLIACIGNHDVNGRFDETESQARHFYKLFLPGAKSYRSVDVGNYLSLFILDSSHTAPIEGEQAKWLKTSLEEREGIKWKFALYHVPAYPSVRAYSGIRSAKIRKHWVPLFEQHGLNAAFENHDHAYKRSHPLLKGAVNPSGVLYIGDGSWGVKKPRIPRTPLQSWYIAKSRAARQVLLVTLQEEGVLYESIDDKGSRIDSYAR